MNKLTTAVWEITMGCNMRCKHCGSSCAEALPDELNTSEALEVCDQLKDLGLKVITLSGGEPTTRSDWHIIAKRLVDNGIITSIITNGWLIDENFIHNAITSGIRSVCLSIDGLEKTHDFIRRSGSLNKSIKALKELRKNNISTSVITSINKENICELEELYQLLIVLADCIGYYSNKDIKVNENFLNDNWSWTGCGAGKHVIGILHNGDIVACTSIRDKTLVAGNIREKSLKSIWESPDSFKWNRNFDSSKLKGFCRECRYCINGSFESENRYCAYNVEMKKWKKYLESLNDISEIDNVIEKAAALKHQDLYKIACEIKQSKL